MRLRPGSFPWLVAHDIRLSWRGFTAMFGRLSSGVIAVLVIAGGAGLHLLAWPVVGWLAPFVHGDETSHAPLVGAIVCAFTWMLAQSLFNATRMLSSRGDLDLLLGSPLPARRIFAAKAASIAASSFGSVALLLLPVANTGAAVDQLDWLGIYPALIALSLIASSGGLAITIAMFCALGPQRAKVWTHVAGAVIAGTFVLGVQIAAILPPSLKEALTQWTAGAAEASGVLTPLWLPVLAVRGDPGAALSLIAVALALFAAATLLLDRRFARISVAAGGAAPSDPARTGKAGRPTFRTGAARSLRRKEWRLLARDPGMFAQLGLQVVYTIPVAVVLLRSETLPAAFALAPTIVVVAAQISASLAWLTVSGEDAPELIATAPVASGDVDRAKLDAVVLPVIGILSIPLAALALVSLHAAVLTALVSAAAGISTALLNFWHPMPGNRRGMLRRHSQSKVVGLVEHAISMLWALTIVLAMLSSELAAIPVAIVIAVLAVWRHSWRRRAIAAALPLRRASSPAGVA